MILVHWIKKNYIDGLVHERRNSSVLALAHWYIDTEYLCYSTLPEPMLSKVYDAK